MRVTAPKHDAGPNGAAGWIRGTVSAPGRQLCPDLGERVVRMSSSLVAPSAVAILSTALLCGLSGTAMSLNHNSRDRPLATQHYRPSAEANSKATEAAAGGKATTEADAGGKRSCISPDIANHSVYGRARISIGKTSQD